jgi:hypothetical protein
MGAWEYLDEIANRQRVNKPSLFGPREDDFALTVSNINAD